MGAYAGIETEWIEDIYQFEETDLVMGGPEGIDNLPLKNLADRTAWLRSKIGIFDRLAGSVPLSGNATLTKDEAGKLIIARATDALTITLADVTTFKEGSIIPVSSFSSIGGVINIQGTGSQKFYDSATGRSVMYMHHAEFLWLMAGVSDWKIVTAKGNFECAGEEIKSRKILSNTLRLEGQLVQRNLYPRLFEFVQSLTVGQEVVSESQWFSDPFRYRGCFTLGNGTSTFRLPDERGMFDRMLDLERGVDISRYHNYPGGYEADEIKSHAHNVVQKKRSASGNDGTNSLISATGGTLNVTTTTESTGGTENLVKNIGKYNLIKF